MADHLVSIRGALDGVTTYNTFSMADIGEGGGPFDSRAKRVGDLWVAHIMQVVCVGWRLEEVRTVEVGGGAESIEPYDAAGAVNAQALPPNCAIHIRKVSGGANRSGRLFVPGVQESQVSNTGKLTEAYRVTAQAEATQFLDGLASANLQMTVGDIPEASPGGGAFNSNVIGLSVRPFIGNQRRRLDRARQV